MSEAPSAPRGSATSAITLLAIAAFAAQAMVRVTNSLLPQIAVDLNVTVGAASVVVTVYLLAHGSVQLVIGPIGDRFGKYLCAGIAAAASTADGAGLRIGALAADAGGRAACQRSRHRRDHSVRDGLRRRRHPL